MAEKKQTPKPQPIDDTLSPDDVSMLRQVLQDSHSRGITPVSVYQQSEMIPEDF